MECPVCGSERVKKYLFACPVPVLTDEVLPWDDEEPPVRPAESVQGWISCLCLDCESYWKEPLPRE